ncbi:hypothetical protein CRE_29437 [Caenorhabditis remanei]|uniref:F-box domain-containing protein n=1 Tax=Caenorhabditis remanei TaxID=31234 RepID=E3LV06_CAERE|nr:hypothetical protein CRE_29437 [Caenorhabditis remanei]
MTKKSIRLSDLPPEMLRLLVEKCDFITRRRLRASSSLMYQLVNSTKLYIPIVKMTLWNEKTVVVELTFEPKFGGYHTLLFEKNQKGETRMESDEREPVVIGNADPMDAAIDWFRQMCLQKNVTIGQLHLGNVNKLTEKLFGVLEKSEFPLKIKSIYCTRIKSADLMWKVMDYCDKSLLKEMKVRTWNPNKIFELFGKQDEIVKNFKKIEIECFCNVSDEDVLSLNASIIFLKFENFTDDLVYKLIEKFTNRREDGSAFCIENSSKRKLNLKIIPPGFKIKKTTIKNGCKEFRNQLIDTSHPTVYLSVSEDRVLLQIGYTKKVNLWKKAEYNHDTSDEPDSSSDSVDPDDSYEESFDQDFDEDDEDDDYDDDFY